LIGRIFLQLGDVSKAQIWFSKGNPDPFVVRINFANLAIFANNYAEALAEFQAALQIQPENSMLINNIAVCHLYLGRLQEAIYLLESKIGENPKKFLNESLVMNLATLYELSSAYSLHKKQNILATLNANFGDAFKSDCLKMQGLI